MYILVRNDITTHPLTTGSPHTTQVLSGFQKFGTPHFNPLQGGPVHSHLSPCLQGLQYAVRCMAQLTATQYATTICPGRKLPSNQGRIIFLTTLKRSLMT